VTEEEGRSSGGIGVKEQEILRYTLEREDRRRKGEGVEKEGKEGRELTPPNEETIRREGEELKLTEVRRDRNKEPQSTIRASTQVPVFLEVTNIEEREKGRGSGGGCGGRKGKATKREKVRTLL